MIIPIFIRVDFSWEDIIQNYIVVKNSFEIRIRN